MSCFGLEKCRWLASRPHGVSPRLRTTYPRVKVSRERRVYTVKFTKQFSRTHIILISTIHAVLLYCTQTLYLVGYISQHPPFVRSSKLSLPPLFIPCITQVAIYQIIAITNTYAAKRISNWLSSSTNASAASPASLAQLTSVYVETPSIYLFSMLFFLFTEYFVYKSYLMISFIRWKGRPESNLIELLLAMFFASYCLFYRNLSNISSYSHLKQTQQSKQTCSGSLPQHLPFCSITDTDSSTNVEHYTSNACYSEETTDDFGGTDNTDSEEQAAQKMSKSSKREQKPTIIKHNIGPKAPGLITNSAKREQKWLDLESVKYKRPTQVAAEDEDSLDNRDTDTLVPVKVDKSDTSISTGTMALTKEHVLILNGKGGALNLLADIVETPEEAERIMRQRSKNSKKQHVMKDDSDYAGDSKPIFREYRPLTPRRHLQYMFATDTVGEVVFTPYVGVGTPSKHLRIPSLKVFIVGSRAANAKQDQSRISRSRSQARKLSVQSAPSTVSGEAQRCASVSMSRCGRHTCAGAIPVSAGQERRPGGSNMLENVMTMNPLLLKSVGSEKAEHVHSNRIPAHHPSRFNTSSNHSSVKSPDNVRIPAATTTNPTAITIATRSKELATQHVRDKERQKNSLYDNIKDTTMQSTKHSKKQQQEQEHIKEVSFSDWD